MSCTAFKAMRASEVLITIEIFLSEDPWEMAKILTDAAPIADTTLPAIP